MMYPEYLGLVGDQAAAYPLSIKRQQPIKMLRVVFLAILCLLATPSAGVAQQPKNPHGSAF
jgi:hypothetical protein